MQKAWLVGMIVLSVCGLAGPSSAAVIDDCDNVLVRAAQENQPDQALSVLGACLATPAPLPVLQRVALEMAIISFKNGDPEWGMRYLEVLSEMYDDPIPTASRK